MALKKLGAAGKFGARYGFSVKKKYLEVMDTLKKKHTCPYCQKEGSVKRLSPGIWYCNKCNSKFAAKAYDSSTTPGEV